MTRTARCSCGACRISTSGEPLINALCNCDNCKARTGSAFGWSAYFSNTQISSKQGKLIAHNLTQPVPQTRHFCATCGTTLFWETGSQPGQTGIAGGCFVAEPLPEPNAVYANGQAHAWLMFPRHWSRSS